MNQFIMPTQPDQKIVRKEVDSLISIAQKLEIKDEDGYIASWAIVGRHDDAMKRVTEVFGPFVQGLHQLHKMAVELRDSFIRPIAVSKNRLLDARSDFRQEQERLKKLEDEAKAAKLQAEQKKELERVAKELAKAGEKEAAAVVREEAKNVPLPVIAPTAAVPKLDGSVIKTRWVFSIDDPDAVERLYCSPDEKKIRKIVEALGDKANLKGVRVWKETKEHSRAVR